MRHAFVNSDGGASLVFPCKVRLGVFILEVATAKGFLKVGLSTSPSVLVASNGSFD